MPLSHYRWFILPVVLAVCSPAAARVQICLKGDGTWYGTTFNFAGRWTSATSGAAQIAAAIYGNYTIQGHDSDIFANDTITVEKVRGGDELVTWYDWYDDLSYQNLVTGQFILPVKKNCDPPFTGENTHAATQ